MAQPMRTTISCPNCQQPFNAILEQLIDVGRDPSAKERLLSGRINMITCPHCGYQGMISTPLVYHDPNKQLAVIFTPMELGLPQAESEKLIGSMTNAIMRSLPEEAPKGYLLQPKTALTFQGLIEQVLEADGITKEVLEGQQRKIELIDTLAEAKSDEVDQLLAENEDLLDLAFFELLTVAAQAASQSGEPRKSLRLLNIRTHLMETTEVGRQLQEQQQAVLEASQELQAMGDQVTREGFVDLLINAADNPAKVEALAVLGRAILDYTTFQLITDRIEQSPEGETRQALARMRDQLLDLSAEFEQRARAAVQQAANTLRSLMEAPDVVSAVQANVDRIDEMFLQVLQANLDEARRAGQIEVSNRLRLIRDEVLKLLQAAAPPELQLINELLGIADEEEALARLRERQNELNQGVLHFMEELSGQLYEVGNTVAAERLDLLRSEAETLTPSS